jgi:hypothetical protein
MSFGVNKFATECDRCGLWLPKGTGHMVGIDMQTRVWRVRCARCAGIAIPADQEIQKHEAVLDYLAQQGEILP